MFGKKKQEVKPVQEQPVQQPQKIEEVEETEVQEEEASEEQPEAQQETAFSTDEALGNLAVRVARIEHFLRLDF